MPRMTRAALRAQEVQIAQDSPSGSDRETSPEESESPAASGIDPKFQTQPALSEVSGNSKALIEAIGGEDRVPAKKQTITRTKGKKIKQALNEVLNSEGNKAGQAGKNISSKEPKQTEEKSVKGLDISGVATREDSPIEPFPSLDISGPDSVREVPDLVTSTEELAISKNQADQDENEQAIKTPPSTGQTPKFDPEEHTVDLPDQESQEDSFVTTIINRSPSKQKSVSPKQTSNEMEEDSFADEIRTRSPVKPLSRFEDSVEAMDALEEALEQVVINLPNIPDDALESPVKTTHAAPKPTVSTQKPTTTGTAQKRKINPAPTVTKSSNTTTKSSASRPKSEVSKKSIPPTLSFSNSPVKKAAGAAPAPKPKVTINVRQSLSTSKPAFVPAKSTKPATRPTFALPGEAIAAKLKAQREERLKQGSESSDTKQSQDQQQQKKTFKARPVPRTSMAVGAPIVRETAASKARQSLMHGSTTKENLHPATSASRSTSTSTKSSRPSTSVSTSTTTTSNSMANTKRIRPSSTLLTTSSTTTAATKPSQPRPISVGAPTITMHKSTVTESDIALQRLRAKQIFARDSKLQADMQQAKKEKEDAARKARAEAAERGRKASREWAERQKLKMAKPNANANAVDAGKKQPTTTTPTTAAAA